MKKTLVELTQENFKLAWKNCRPVKISSYKQKEWFKQKSIVANSYYRPEFEINDIVIFVLIIENQNSLRVLCVKVEDILKNFIIKTKPSDKYFILTPISLF